MTTSAAGSRLSSGRFDITLAPLPPLNDLKTKWLELEARAQTTFFTSWTWIGAWLETLSSHQGLALLTAEADRVTVGLGIIGLGPRHWRKLGRRSYILNQTGDPRLDAIYIEYNDFLLAQDIASEARSACLGYLAAQKPFLAQAALPDLSEGMTSAFRTLRNEACAYVDLSRIPDGIGDATHDQVPSGTEEFLNTLGRNSRYQVRRALRLAEASGPLQLSRPDSAVAAQRNLAELASLHSAAWQQRRGRPGAFVNPHFYRFVERLVEVGTEVGHVDVLRIGNTSQTLGFLLNFVYREEVYAYQSGFVYEKDNRVKPGLVCHALAIAYYRSRGCRGYHFMAGEARYKTTLSNETEALVWLESRPDGIVSSIEDVCRGLWDTSRQLFK